MLELINQLKSIESFLKVEESLSTIEKDIVLQKTREFYEMILKVQTFETEIKATLEKPDVENEIVNIAESTGSIKEMAKTVFVLNKNKEDEDEIADEEFIAEENLEEEQDYEVNNKEDEDEENNEVDENIEESMPIIKNDSSIKLELNPTNDKNEEPIHKETNQKESNKETILENSAILDFKIWNKDIRTYIGINDKYNFISELFGNNPEAYDEILNEINKRNNKTEALKFLDNSGITTLYDWQKDGLSEEIFYNILSQFFSSR